jgi:amidase
MVQSIWLHGHGQYVVYAEFMTTDLCFLPAIELARLLRNKEISAREVLSAHLQQIERVNPKVNAIVTLVPEQALAGADLLDSIRMRGEILGPLHGLPIAHKDLQPTRGIRTTYGSPIYHDHIPQDDSLVVERLKLAGAITLGKTNVPEFGAGSQTFNPVFGPTRNPYDLTRTSGGSSGGAAAALACGLIPIADGSDMGGSLRNPAGFCNVVGLRPSPGRVPSWPVDLGWFTLSVDGPMARTVADVALTLSALAGPDPRSPISLREPGSRFAEPLERDFKGTRVAWVHLGLPYEPEVTQAVNSTRGRFESLGCIIEEVEPDFSDADEIFKTWRAWSFEAGLSEEYNTQKDKLKNTVIWNIEQGLSLTGPQLARVEVKRTQLFHRIREFMAKYEFLILPVSQVLPFDVEKPYPNEINGEKMLTYIDWMKSCYYISTIGHPALSVPGAFTSSGLPVGAQIVGRHLDDWGVLQLGYAVEQATQHWKRHPEIAL